MFFVVVFFCLFFSFFCCIIFSGVFRGFKGVRGTGATRGRGILYIYYKRVYMDVPKSKFCVQLENMEAGGFFFFLAKPANGYAF